MNTNQLNEIKEHYGFNEEELEAYIRNAYLDEGIRVFPTHTEEVKGGQLTIRIPTRRK